jgi:hypothetical protein
MRRWLALTVLVVAGACLWALRDGPRAKALAGLAPPVRAAPADARSGPAELEPVDRDVELGSRTAAALPVPELADVATLDAPPPNALDLLVLAADGTLWVAGQVRIRAARSPILSAHRPPFPAASGSLEVNAWTARLQAWELSTDEGVHSVYRTDPQGRVRIVGVAPGQPFALLAVDALGVVGGRSDEAPMHLGEERHVLLRLSRVQRPLQGLCTLPDGRAVSEAVVSARERTETLNVHSDGEGRFATSPLFSERVLVQARHPEHGLATLADVDPQRGPVVLQLQPTRDLSVRLVGERGGNPSTRWMRLRLVPDGPDVADPPGVREGLHVFEEVPRGPLTLVLEHPAPRRVLAVAPGIEALTWVVPEQGEVVLSLDALPEREDARYALEFRSLDGAGTDCDVWPLRSSEAQDVRQTLWGGTYEVRVLLVPYAAPDRPVPWSAPVTVAIRAGESTHAQLGR